MPPDAMATAKVRLKLYAGLNEVALEALFAPKPGAIAACTRDVGASQSECEALVAAAGGSSVAKIRKVAGGPAPMPMMAAAPVQSGYGAGGVSHFGGGYNPVYQQGQAAPAPQQQGFGGGYHPPAYQQQPQGYGNAPGYAAAQPTQQRYAAPQYAPQQQQYAPRPQQAYAPAYAARPPVQQQAYAAPQQPAYRPAPVAAAAPYVAPPPAAPVVSAQEQASRKEAYKAQREAYLARQKAEFQARKDKSAGLETNPDNAPPPAAKTAAAAPVPAKAAGKVTAPAAEEVAAADTKHPVAAAAPEAPAAKSEAKPAAALDNSFLDGLLDDPLGGKKK
jgi:hypothetical protein